MPTLTIPGAQLEAGDTYAGLAIDPLHTYHAAPPRECRCTDIHEASHWRTRACALSGRVARARAHGCGGALSEIYLCRGDLDVRVCPGNEYSGMRWANLAAGTPKVYE